MARRWLSARRSGLKHALQGVKDDNDDDDDDDGGEKHTLRGFF